MIELILGGVKSGKSRHAEGRAQTSGLEVCYIATAEPRDAEMAARIATHRARRPAAWQTLECPIALTELLREQAAPGRLLLVECLTLWLTNLLCAEDGDLLAHERDSLLATLPGLPGRVILVSNETGLGVIPLGELSRRYCDEAGALHQQLAALADQVTLVVAGLPLSLKGAAHA